MDAESILISGIGGMTAALGLMWAVLDTRIRRAEAACDEDRRLLREIVSRVGQLDRRKESQD